MALELTTAGFSALGAVDPGSEACAKAGGTETVRETAQGKRGECIFPDGSSCFSMDLYSGACAPGRKAPSRKTLLAGVAVVGGLAFLLTRLPTRRPAYRPQRAAG